MHPVEVQRLSQAAVQHPIREYEGESGCGKCLGLHTSSSDCRTLWPSLSPAILVTAFAVSPVNGVDSHGHYLSLLLMGTLL